MAKTAQAAFLSGSDGRDALLALREQNKDYALLRKVFGSKQIDDLIAQAREAQQAKQRHRRLKNHSYER